ncbi:hypothetical protein CsSME_00053864 [Camellia sinensis var. sinensis]
MAVGVIVVEGLTLIGLIGVVTGKFNLRKLYKKIGVNKEMLSRGRFAQLAVAEHGPFRPDEVELFAKSAQNAYKQFRDKAAYSRSITVDKIEEVAQGREWTGKEVASRGLVDAIGGFSIVVAIAKQKADITPRKRGLILMGILNVKVTLVEQSRPSPTLPEILVVIELLQDLAFSDEIQALIDGIMFQKLDGVSNYSPLYTLIKDYLCHAPSSVTTPHTHLSEHARLRI